jgi:hypothetical protein
MSRRAGVREWLSSAEPATKGMVAAAFTTRIAAPWWVPGSAAKGVAKRLRRLGYTLLGKPEDFFVEGTKGPQSPGELERARTWGADLGARCAAVLARRQ